MRKIPVYKMNSHSCKRTTIPLSAPVRRAAPHSNTKSTNVGHLPIHSSNSSNYLAVAQAAEAYTPQMRRSVSSLGPTPPSSIDSKFAEQAKRPALSAVFPRRSAAPPATLEKVQYDTKRPDTTPEPIAHSQPPTTKTASLYDTNSNDIEIPEKLDVFVELIPCPHCDRKFIDNRLDKHISVCAKTGKARKVFESRKARVQGTDLEKYQTKRKDAPVIEKKSNWRAKHQTFINMVRGARSGTDEPTVDPNPDYVTCPHCTRRFNQGAADRHVPHCKNNSKTQKMKGSNDEALKKRTMYKPPTPKKSRK